MARVAASVTALFGIVLAAGAARGDGHPRESAAAYFDRGAANYNLGHFPEAIAEFEKAYQIEPSPILLFNIAQCQRQLGNNERALFLYRRYLELAPKAPNRADVTRRIADLEQLAQREHAEAEARARAAAASAALARQHEREVAAATTVKQARGRWNGPWALGAAVAPAFVRFWGAPLDDAIVFAARVEGAYGLFVRDGAVLRLGADVPLAFVPFRDLVSNERRTSVMWGLLATARYQQRVRPDLSLGGGLGAGLVWWSGLDRGNPFTVNAMPTDGAALLPTFTVEARGEYTLERGVYLTLAPELVVSKTTGARLSDVTGGMVRFDLTVGVGYTF